MIDSLYYDPNVHINHDNIRITDTDFVDVDDFVDVIIATIML